MNLPVWNDAVEEQFINLVEERPALYDITDRSYSNRGVKAELWRDIQDKLQISEKEIRKRWESLRTQFSRYHKMPLAGRTTRQQWILSRLQFLEPHTKRKECLSQLTHREPFASELECPSEGPSDATWTSTLEACTQSPSPETAPLDSPALPLAESTICGNTQSRFSEAPSMATDYVRPRVKRARKDDSVGETPAGLMVALNKTLAQLNQEKEDCISVYCKYFEHRLRGVPQHLLPRLQRDIENILYTYSVDEKPTDL